MINLFIAFICLLPFSPFFFKQCDVWHAAGQFTQLGILILFSYSFFEKPKRAIGLNKPLGAFFCWAGITTAYYWIQVFVKSKHYPIKIFMPFFNLLCLIILYKLVVEYLDETSIRKIFKWFKYSLTGFIIYCSLQYLQLDEFFKNVDGPDLLVGTIGNPSHLSALLAITQPIFFNKNRQDMICLSLLWLLIILTGSASGMVCAGLVVLFWLFNKNIKIALVSSGLFISTLGFVFIKHHHYFTDSGRFRIWQAVLDIFKKKPVTGSGIGSFGTLTVVDAGTRWQHLHNEYYQTAFELGLVGLVLVLWCIMDYCKSVKLIKSDITIRLASIFTGFCLLSVFNFVGHLWIISTFFIFSYACIYAIKNSGGEPCILGYQ